MGIIKQINLLTTVNMMNHDRCKMNINLWFYFLIKLLAKKTLCCSPYDFLQEYGPESGRSRIKGPKPVIGSCPAATKAGTEGIQGEISCQFEMFTPASILKHFGCIVGFFLVISRVEELI